MSEAPERIWADLNMGIWLGAPQPNRRPAPPTEYIRADIAERDLAEARAAAERQWEGWIKEEALRKAAEAERDRLAAEVEKALSQGYWEASIYHCPPPRSRRDHPLKHAATIRLSEKFSAETEAIRYAEEQIQRGWANTTTVHQETAKPKATFWLSRDAQDSLGRLCASLQPQERTNGDA